MSMNIPANTANLPEMNLGQMFQMLNTADSSQLSGAGLSTGMNENSEESGKQFCKVLCQQLALLLQSGSSESLEAQGALPGMLEKYLPDHPDAAGQLIAEIEMLLMSGQIAPMVMTDASILSALGIGSQDDSDPATQANHSLMPQKSLDANFLAASQKDGLNEFHTVASKVAPDSFIDALLKQDQGSGKPSMTEEQLKAMADPDKKMNMSSADAAVTPKGYAASSPETSASKKMPFLSDGRDQVSATRNVQDLLNEGKVKEPVLNDQVKKVDVSEGVGKRMTFEALDKATQTSIVQDKTLTGQVAVESHLSKTGIVLNNAVLEKDNRQNVSPGLRTDGQLSGADEKNAMSVMPKQSVTDIQAFMKGTNPDRQNEGKAFAFQLDNMQAHEKAGAAVKNTFLSTGKTVESNLFNTTAASGVVPLKTESGDVTASSIINRVAAEFRENLMNEGGRVRITLTPPSLGTLQMDVSVQNGKVRVMLLAENKDIQRMLSGNLDALKGSLQSQGMTIERCDVMMQDRREEYSQGFNGQHTFQHDQAERERNSRREDIDNHRLTVEDAPTVQKPLSRPMPSGSESISLFA